MEIQTEKETPKDVPIIPVAQPVPVKVEVKKVEKIPQLNPIRMQLAEHKRNVWDVTVEQNVSIPMMEDPQFWAHIAEKLKPKDKIEVTDDEMSFYAEFIVIAAERSWAHVRRLSLVPLISPEDVPQDVDVGYTMKWRGPYHLWSVIRTSDHAVIKSGMQREECKVWLDEYLKKVK